jgi:hypothetical protein
MIHPTAAVPLFSFCMTLRCLFYACLVLLPLCLSAQTVTADFEPNPIAPGEVGRLIVTLEDTQVKNMNNPELPDGLQLVGGGQMNRQFQIINGQQSSSITVTWPVMAVRAGSYTIPAMQLDSGGQIIATQAVEVVVGESEARTTQRQSLDPIMQLTPEKTEFYLGEMVPLTAKIFVPRRVGLQQVGLIEVEKQDLAIQRFPTRPQQEMIQIEGKTFTQLSFPSVMSSLKAGKVKIGPAKAKAVVEVATNSGSGFFGMLGEQREVLLQAPAVSVNVLPLPTVGKPANFSGAVGEFSFQATAEASSGRVGEPVAVDLSIQGQGNFDAIGAPVLTAPEGWKLYPPRRYSVDSDDPNRANLSNRKIGFNVMMVPEKPMMSVPPFEFSYFNPNRKEYVNLRSQPLQVIITGEAVQKVEPPSVAVAGAPAVAAPEADITDILTVLPAAPQWARVNVPWFKDWVVIVLNAVGFLVLVGWLAKILLQSRRTRGGGGSPEFSRRQLWAELTQEGLSEGEFYRRVVHYLQQLGLQGLGSVRPIFARYETLNFNSAAAAAVPVDKVERQRVLDEIQTLRAAPGAPLLKLVAVMLAVVAVSGGGGAAAAAEVEADYALAVKALERGDYVKAQELGEALLKEGKGVSPEVFSLMGHALYKQKEPGLAAMWYQRAWVFPGASAELRQNLRHLSEKLLFLRPDWESAAVSASMWLSRRGWVLLASVGVWVALLCGVGIFRKRRLWWLLSLGVLLGLVTLAAAAVGAVLRPSYAGVEKLRFITAEKVAAHSAATVMSGHVIDLPVGSMVLELQRRGGWTYVQTFSEPGYNEGLTEVLRGWVQTGALVEFWPYAPELLP